MRWQASSVALALALVAPFALGAETRASSGAYVVVDIIDFTGPSCSAAVVEISNQGDADQPFGWTLALSVPNAGIDQTYFGEQPLAAGASYQTLIGTGITEAGTYLVKISPEGISGRSKSGHAVLRLPSTC